MTSTKVECQEIGSEGPNVEEIASYSYTLHEENSPKPQNGMLIEEYSESDDNLKARLQVNRGVSIVSVSDDESTMKAISRDVSSDDIRNTDIYSLNGGQDESFVLNGKTFEERSVESAIPNGALRYTETIVEERSLEESLSGKKPVTTEVVETSRTQRASIVEGRFSRQSSKIEESPQQIETQDGPIAQNADLRNGKLSRQNSRISRVESVEEKFSKSTDLEESKPLNGVAGESKLSRQSSKIGRSVSVESSKSTIGDVSRQNSQKGARDGDEEVDEEMEALLDRIKRQRSVLNDILDKEAEGEGSGNVEIVSACRRRYLILAGSAN